MIFIREEKADDIEQIKIINEQAFGQPAEANIIDMLRKSCSDLLSSQNRRRRKDHSGHGPGPHGHPSGAAVPGY